MKEDLIYKKHFTLEEANKLVPQFTQYFDEIFTLHNILKKERNQKELVTQSLSKNGGWSKSAEYLENSFKVSKLLDKILATGAVVKDLQRGLIDFPHLSEGKEVYLCWQIGEKQVKFWHDLESGYAGRQPLYLD
ncbi:MAG: hypothetical protein RBG1_1C00001G0819 [candidate division Zixibacteria bacterium RBG-1]|nr:MAG: hypothetical protein RBG1_1C00001G0819 [candidate division Zixibacteria bacterium RBG-1]OGC83505.1 MAG: hypothetical protein A2V73_03895 [candidate division Zixibacteria bacterium RBG_19FT_COMBO_42_43]